MSRTEIICENIYKSFSGIPVFKNLSFRISTSESLSITGKNGSGKSTLIKILANLIHSTKGKISILENGSDIPDEKRFYRTGLISPYLNLYDELTGYENLAFFYELKSRNKDLEEQVGLVLERTGLHEKRNELVKNYSSGMKQKLKIAFAIMTQPEILLMDEPRTNLDKQGIELIQKISDEQKNKGILIVATNEDSDKRLCDNSINIEDYK
ncbi:MAG: ABC transporter ATP-binding protein [bacterium]|nr:ABC transporter ATP-binding protein [bacterium]